jgi:nucleoid DNA-binding protein
MPSWLIIIVAAALVVTSLGGWLLHRAARRRRWQAIEAAPAPAVGPESPATPRLERPTLASLDLSQAMARAVAWADQAERDGRGLWRDARGEQGPEEYLELFGQVQDLLPEVFGDDVMGLSEGPPPEVTLRVDGLPWVVALQRQEGFLDEAFWTFLNRVLEARACPERLAAPRLANWRIPLVVSSAEELRSLRGEGLGFVGSTPPLHPRLEAGGERRFHKQPHPEPALFLRDLGRALGVGEASAQAALSRLGRLLALHLHKYRMLQLGGFGSFQLRVGPQGAAHLRFRAARPLRERVANPVLQAPPVAPPRLPAIDPQSLQAVLAVTVQHLSMGSGAVEIPGFGLFWRDRHPASMMRHPQNQQPLLIPARRDVVFEPEVALLEPDD